MGEAFNGNHEFYSTSPSTRPNKERQDNDGDEIMGKTRLKKRNNQPDIQSPQVTGK